MSDMRDDIASVLLSAEEIQARTAELGAQISRDFDGREPLFVGVLKGCFVFMADLMRSVTIPCSVDFMAVSSYGNQTTTTGAVKINKDLNQDIEGRDIILVEDILDSGVTLHYLKDYLSVRRPASITIAPCSISLPAARHRSMPPMPALRCRTRSSSATGSTMQKNTAISRTSACSSRRSTPPERPDADPIKDVI